MSALSTIEDAFRTAILETPDDDTPRLVFADWLDENGQPDRAAFIRCQCRPDPPRLTLTVLDDGNGVRLEVACDEPPSWLHPARHLAGLPVENGARYEFHRGFVQAVRLSAQTWVHFAQRLLEHHPIEQVALTKHGRLTSYLRALRCWGRVRLLQFVSPLTEHQIRMATGATSRFGKLCRLEASRFPPEGQMKLRDALPGVEVDVIQYAPLDTRGTDCVNIVTVPTTQLDRFPPNGSSAWLKRTRIPYLRFWPA
jgi:uncharacterized protein (TIGR02996 family)